MGTYIEGLGRNAPDYDLVQSVVRDVLHENSIIEPPISPREIAENYGLRVIFADFPDSLSNVMGFFDFEGGGIYVNAADAPNRQTFTVAHELGHERLHRQYIKNNPAEYKFLLRQPLAGAKDSIEQEANAFAAHLLVPRDMLKRYVNVASVPELSRLFVVSEEVIRWRLKNEKLAPA